MSKFSAMIKRNPLAPLGHLGVAMAVVGFFLPWTIVQGKYIINGTTELLGWVVVGLSLLYSLVLITHFRWTIILALIIKIVEVYLYFTTTTAVRENPELKFGIGNYFILFSGLFMIIGCALLVKPSKSVSARP